MRNINKDLNAINAEFITLSEESQRTTEGGLIATGPIWPQYLAIWLVNKLLSR